MLNKFWENRKNDKTFKKDVKMLLNARPVYCQNKKHIKKMVEILEEVFGEKVKVNYKYRGCCDLFSTDYGINFIISDSCDFQTKMLKAKWYISFPKFYKNPLQKEKITFKEIKEGQIIFSEGKYKRIYPNYISDGISIGKQRLIRYIKSEMKRQNITTACTVYAGGRQIVESVSKGCTTVPLLVNVTDTNNGNKKFKLYAPNGGIGALTSSWYDKYMYERNNGCVYIPK